MNKKLLNNIALFFIIGIIIVVVFNWFNRPKVNLPADENYFAEQINSHKKYIENKFPDIPVKKEIPYFSSDEYFDYRVMPSFAKPDKFDVFLTPRFSDVNTIENAFPITQSNILQWIANHNTLVSRIQIDWYIEYNREKILVDQTNPDA